MEAINEAELTYVPKVLSGIDLIDTSWGGMYQGGSYLCYGHAASGRGLLGMLFLQTGVMLKENGLFLSTGRPHDWMIQAASVNFDLKAARDEGKVRLVWIPSSFDDHMSGSKDVFRVMEELIKIVQKESPKRFVINDFSPFLRFNSFEYFQSAFVHLMQQLDKIGDTTILLMMPDAVNRPSSQIIDFMKNHVTGSLHISLEHDEGSENKRKVLLQPGIGHVNHEVFSQWTIPGESHSSTPEFDEIQTNLAKDVEKPVLEAQPLQAGSLARIEEVTSLQGELAVPTVGVESLQKVVIEHEIFFSRLQHLFKERELSYYDPFLLVALRVESDQIELDGEIVLENLLEVISDIVEDEDHVLVDLERERIILVLTNRGSDSIQDVFELLQSLLKEQSPDLAEMLPKAISAVVASDGHPFESPDEFLAYALEGE